MSGAPAGTIRGIGFALMARGEIAISPHLPNRAAEQRFRQASERQSQAIADRLDALRAAIEGAVAAHSGRSLQFRDTAPESQPLPLNTRPLHFPCALLVRATSSHLSDIVPGGLLYELHLLLEDGAAEDAHALGRECLALLALEGKALEQAVEGLWARQMTGVPDRAQALRRKSPALHLTDRMWTGETFWLSFNEWDQSSILIERPLGSFREERERREQAEAFTAAAQQRLQAIAPSWMEALARATARGVRLRRESASTYVHEGDALTMPCVLQFLRTVDGRDGNGAIEPVYHANVRVDEATPDQVRELVAELSAALRGETCVPATMRTAGEDGPWNEPLAGVIASMDPSNEALGDYADWLCGSGNPLEALSALEPHTPKHDETVMAWLEALSPSAAVHASAGRLEFGWNHGFVESLTLSAAGLAPGSTIFSRILKHPLARFVRTVELQARHSSDRQAATSLARFGDEGVPAVDFGNASDGLGDLLIVHLVEQLQAAGPPHLQTLEVCGDGATALRLDELFRSFTALESLTLDHCLPILRGPPAGSRLRYLEVADTSGGMLVNDDFNQHLASLGRIAASSFPMLETLKLSFFWESVDLGPLFRGVGVPKLHTLALGELVDIERHLPQLMDSALLPALRVLAIPDADLRPAEALLVRRASAFAHLASFDLSNAIITAASKKKLLEAGVRLVT